MASIRAQLTAAYAAALLTTVAVFAAISYATTLSADRTARQHAVEQYVASEADLLLRTVEQAEASGEPLVTYTTVIINKKLDSIPNVTPKLRTVLEGVPDYALVLDAKGRTLYNSFAFRQLDQDDQVALSQAALALRADTFPPATVQLRSRQLLVMARSVPSAGPITRVVAGSEAKDTNHCLDLDRRRLRDRRPRVPPGRWDHQRSRGHHRRPQLASPLGTRRLGR
jgi:hypothetical protein